MNKLIVTVLCVLCVCSVAKADFTAWIWADTDYSTETNQFGGKAGWMFVEQGVEVGIVGQGFAERPKDVSLGFYALLWLEQTITIENPLPVGPEEVVAEPYIGYQIFIEDTRAFRPSGLVSGAKFMEIFFIEYQWREDMADAACIGARLQF